MTPFVVSVTHVLAFITLCMQALTLAVLAALCMPHSVFGRSIINFFARYVLVVGFFIAFGSIVGSLFYSQYAGFFPCVLCWIQRIFMYPQIILLGLALWKNDVKIVPYSLALAVPGVFVAMYHTYIQFGGSPLVPCGLTGVTCGQRFFLEFGYITIPTMSLTVFVLLAIVLYVRIKVT